MIDDEENTITTPRQVRQTASSSMELSVPCLTSIDTFSSGSQAAKFPGKDFAARCKIFKHVET